VWRGPVILVGEVTDPLRRLARELDVSLYAQPLDEDATHMARGDVEVNGGVAALIVTSSWTTSELDSLVDGVCSHFAMDALAVLSDGDDVSALEVAVRAVRNTDLCGIFTRSQLERALAPRESKERAARDIVAALSGAMDALDLCIAVVDMDGRIVVSNYLWDVEFMEQRVDGAGDSNVLIVPFRYGSSSARPVLEQSIERLIQGKATGAIFVLSLDDRERERVFGARLTPVQVGDTRHVVFVMRRQLDG